MITAAYYSILVIISSTGYLLVRDLSYQRLYSLKWRIANKIKSGRAFQGRFSGIVFKDTIFAVDRRYYETVRLLAIAAGAAAGLATRCGGMFIAALAAYAASAPSETAGRFTTPYGLLCRLMRKHTLNKIDEEIFEAMAFLKNIASSGKNFRYGADSTIEQLAGYGDLLKPIYFKMLNLLRINRKEEAIEYFARETGTRSGRDFGRLLIQLDEISPRELEETLLSCQKSIREVKITRQKQQDETISDLLYLPVVMNVLLIFINFIYVSYFIEQKNMFGVLVN